MSDRDTFIACFLTGCATVGVLYGIYLLATAAGVLHMIIMGVVYLAMGLLIAFMGGTMITMLGGLVLLIGLGIREAFRKPTVEVSDQLELPF